MEMQANVLPHSVEGMALAYKNAEDEFDKIPMKQLLSFRQLVNLQFSDISRKVIFHFVDYEPYGIQPTIAEMLKDFHQGYILIHTTGNDSKAWGTFTNLQFRAIHDYIHCLYNLEFNHANEIKAFQKQFEFSVQARYANEFPWLNWETYKNILRSEIVYQSAYKETFDKFHIDQKIILKEL